MAIVRRMPRVQEIVLPLLRDAFEDVEPVVTFGSWMADVDFRSYPLVNVRRLGGSPVNVDLLDQPVIEMTAYSRDGLVATEELYLDCRQVLWDAVKRQTVTDKGSLSSFFEVMGMTQFDSPIEDTWRVQGLIQLGVRPPKL